MSQPVTASGDGAPSAIHTAPSAYIDSDHPAVQAFARDAVGDATDPVEKARRLYYAVRDRFIYDPYDIDLSPDAFRASTILASNKGFCVTKAVLLAAAARAVGLPAKLGFGDVRNHLSTKKLAALMGDTDVFIWHGYTGFWLNGRWWKATPAFNIGLCEKFRVLPLEFDGTFDSVFHPYDADGRRHMEYVHERGWFDDLPFDTIRDDFMALYPYLKDGSAKGDFAADAAAENVKSIGTT